MIASALKSELFALATLLGTIIGVGIFGLPYVTAQAGFWPVLVYFVLLGIVMMVAHLLYGEIVMRTPGVHRLPGYCRIYLGKSAEALGMVTSGVGFIGSLLLYIIVGGGFLYQLLAPLVGFGDPFHYITLYWLAGSVIVLLGSSSVGRTNFWAMIFLAVILSVLAAVSFPAIQLNHFTSVNLGQLFLPYGVILFSLSGSSVIPELIDMLGAKQRSRLSGIIVAGSLIPCLVYLIFILVVVGVSGPATTREAFAGLAASLPGPVVFLGLLFGLLTTFTSFISLGITLKKQMEFDAHFHPALAWGLACLLPFMLFAAGFKDYILIMGFIGSALMGIDILLTALVYVKAKTRGQLVPAYQLSLSRPVLWLVIGIILLGIGIELAHLAGLA